MGNLVAKQDTAFRYLAGLLSPEETGVNYVYLDEPNTISADLPALVIGDSDEGGRAGVNVILRRPGNAQRELEVRVWMRVYISLSDRDNAHYGARDILFRILDRLDDDITLGGTVSRTTWADGEGLVLTEVTRGGVAYVAVEGEYILWINDPVEFH